MNANYLGNFQQTRFSLSADLPVRKSGGSNRSSIWAVWEGEPPRVPERCRTEDARVHFLPSFLNSLKDPPSASELIESWACRLPQLYHSSVRTKGNVNCDMTSLRSVLWEVHALKTDTNIYHLHVPLLQPFKLPKRFSTSTMLRSVCAEIPNTKFPFYLRCKKKQQRWREDYEFCRCGTLL